MKKGIEEYLTASGIFTKTDREYLLGESYESDRKEQKRRQRIRERLQTAFLDLNLAANHLSETDRELLFSSIVDSSGPIQGWDEEVRQGQLGGLQEALSFIHDGLENETHLDAGKLFIEALEREEWVSSTAQDLDRIVGKLLRGVEPSLEEYRLLVDLLHDDAPDQLNQVFEQTPTSEKTPATQKIDHMRDLAERDLPDLWRPVLEAGQLPYDEDLLQSLRQKTKERA